MAYSVDFIATEDITIANSAAMTYPHPDFNKGNHENISVVNYTC